MKDYRSWQLRWDSDGDLADIKRLEKIPEVEIEQEHTMSPDCAVELAAYLEIKKQLKEANELLIGWDTVPDHRHAITNMENKTYVYLKKHNLKD